MLTLAVYTLRVRKSTIVLVRRVNGIRSSEEVSLFSIKLMQTL